MVQKNMDVASKSGNEVNSLSVLENLMSVSSSLSSIFISHLSAIKKTCFILLQLLRPAQKWTSIFLTN